MYKIKTSPFLLFLLFLFSSPAYGQTSLGIGVSEQPLTDSGMLIGFFTKLHLLETYFERLMAQHLLMVKNAPLAGFLLIGISLIYGILHAAGPGHGKMIISSYILANNTTLKRGILITFFASLLQAIAAITIILTVFFFIPIRWTTAAFWVKTLSFFLIMLLGLHMFYKATKRLLAVCQQNKKNEKICASSEKDYTANSQNFCNCGKSHIPTTNLIETNFSWKTALSAIFSVGLRPCSGALIIMSFALIHKMYIPGFLSVFAMSLGTFITTSLLAILTVNTKRFATYYLKKTQKTQISLILIDWLAAFAIFLMGLLFTLSSFF